MTITEDTGLSLGIKIHQTSPSLSDEGKATSRHAIMKSEVFSPQKPLGVGGCRAEALSEGGHRILKEICQMLPGCCPKAQSKDI